MYKNIYEVDESGFLKAIFLIGFDKKGNPVEPLPEHYVTEDPPQGLYRARWDGEEWAEDMTEAEIQELNNRPREPTTEERLSLAENAVLDILLEN